MAGRAYWKGYLKLSLVSCPVKLFSATSANAGKISFNMLHKDTLNRVQQKYHDQELEEVEIESSKTIDIDGFVDAGDIDPIYLDSTYYLAPDGPIAEETFAVILEAMRHAKKVAVARIVLAGRERLVEIEPITDGFRLMTLRSAKEIREPATALDKLNVKVPPDMLKMAEMIISQKEMTFEPEAFEDRYEGALMDLVKSKIAGGQPVISKAPERGNVVNLMDALKRSIEQERRPPAPNLDKAPAKAASAKAAAPAAAKKKKAATA